MKYEDLKQNIIDTTNRWGDATINIIETTVKAKGLEVWLGIKKHKGLTIFIVFKTSVDEQENKWLWFCPSEEQLIALTGLDKAYFIIEGYNKLNQEGRKECNT